ncbi:MAG: DUF2955 domain-containing protein [Gemmatimonadota bacterium]|nr:MAG: DUF2955 domain-containing protein [Gemmatimonadota bacterium]
MSAEATVTPSAATTWRSDARTVRTFRYAGGSTLAVALAMGIDWQLSFLAPILALSFLGTPAPRPAPKLMVTFIVIVAAASLFGVTVSALLLPYPIVFLLVEGLLLFLLFYHLARGAPALLVTWLMIALTVIPVMALQSMELAIAIAKGLVVGAAGALAIVWITHVLLPDPITDVASATTAPNGKERSAQPTRHECATRAWLNTVVVFPVVALYLMTGLTSVLILVMIALLSMQPDVSTGYKAGIALIVGNLMGGIAAIVMYELLVMVPEYAYLILLTFLAALFFGGQLFSDKPKAPLFGMAYSTMLLVVLSTTSSFGDADAKAWTRVAQITIAVVYLVVAYGAIRSLRGKPESAHATS